MSHAPASGLDTADADTGPALAFGTESPSRRLAKSGSCRLPQSPLTRLSQLTHGPRPVPVRYTLRNSGTRQRTKEKTSLARGGERPREEAQAGACGQRPGPPPCRPPKGDKPGTASRPERRGAWCGVTAARRSSDTSDSVSLCRQGPPAGRFPAPLRRVHGRPRIRAERGPGPRCTPRPHRAP